MIPDFGDNGYLPPGIPPATMEEIEIRFGRETEIRIAELQSLYWLLDLAKRAGSRRIIVNGSFVTDAMEPNDVDCAVLIDADYPIDEAAGAELLDGLPFLQYELLYLPDFETMVNGVYGSDRWGVPKGVVEVIGWH